MLNSPLPSILNSSDTVFIYKFQDSLNTNNVSRYLGFCIALSNLRSLCVRHDHAEDLVIDRSSFNNPNRGYYEALLIYSPRKRVHTTWYRASHIDLVGFVNNIAHKISSIIYRSNHCNIV